ncbi:MAG: TetR/AcrR family transcriptional regulator [Cyanobacteria bacterium]|nr:TetR/AcrR family transcriptional regulator [Cyanobacteriota bacterium]MDA0867545.1 TetR/AcrR family transcriptional regulator [Cyanobacteriota bacterium]
MCSVCSAEAEDLTDPRPTSIHNLTDKALLILEGALKTFAASGYAAASMDRIAAAAGVSKPTLYSYFQDKEGLFKALVCQFILEKPHAALEESLLLQAPLRDSLKYLASTLLDDTAGKQPQFTFIRLVIGESERFPDLARTFLEQAHKPALEKLTYLFTHHPDANAVDPEVSARIFGGSIIHYMITQEILHGRDIVPMERDRFINGLVDVLVK